MKIRLVVCECSVMWLFAGLTLAGETLPAEQLRFFESKIRPGVSHSSFQGYGVSLGPSTGW